MIGTHHGTFHCDEALACAMLKLLPEYADSRKCSTLNVEYIAHHCAYYQLFFGLGTLLCWKSAILSSMSGARTTQRPNGLIITSASSLEHMMATVSNCPALDSSSSM